MRVYFRFSCRTVKLCTNADANLNIHVVMLSLRFISTTLQSEKYKHFYSFVRWLIINTLKNKLKIVAKIFGELKQKYYL